MDECCAAELGFHLHTIVHAIAIVKPAAFVDVMVDYEIPRDEDVSG